MMLSKLASPAQKQNVQMQNVVRGRTLSSLENHVSQLNSSNKGNPSFLRGVPALASVNSSREVKLLRRLIVLHKQEDLVGILASSSESSTVQYVKGIGTTLGHLTWDWRAPFTIVY